MQSTGLFIYILRSWQINEDSTRQQGFIILLQHFDKTGKQYNHIIFQMCWLSRITTDQFMKKFES